MAAALKLRLPPRDQEERKQRDDSDMEIVTAMTSRFQYLISIQRLWAVEWQEIADYTLPRKNSVIIQRIPGSKRTQRLFESTAISARNKFASAIHGGLTSSYLRWFFLATDDPDLNKDQDTAIWLDQVGQSILDDFNRSNFSQEIDEAYIDLTTFASAAIFMEEVEPETKGHFSGFRFKTEQVGTFAWSEGADGRVNCLFRELQMSKAAIKEKWGDIDDSKLGTENKDEMLSVIHGVEPRRDGKTWDSRYFITQSKYLLSDKSFNEFPFLCPRWSKASGETYGRGPTHDAIPDIRSLNKLREMQLRALPKIIDPPLIAVGGDVIGPARLTPGGVSTLRAGADPNSLRPLMSGINLQQAMMSEEELRKGIRDIYHEDEITMQEGPQMTAYEVSQRLALMQMLLGPTLGRIEKEMLHPLISRAFNIKKRAGALPPLPSSMQNAMARKKIGLRVTYDGPVARAQRASDVDGMAKLEQFIEPIIQRDPTSADVLDSDAMIRVAARKIGVDPTIVRDAAKTDKVRQIKAQQNQQQQQQQTAAQGVASAGQMAPLLKVAAKKPDPGSPLANVLQNQQQQPPPQ